MLCRDPVKALTGDLSQASARRRPRLCLQNAQCLGLALQLGQTLRRVPWSDDDLIEHARLAVSGAAELADLSGQLLIHLPGARPKVQ